MNGISQIGDTCMAKVKAQLHVLVITGIHSMSLTSGQLSECTEGRCGSAPWQQAAKELTDNHAGRRSPAEALQESCFRNISREAVSWLLFHNWPWAQKAKLGKCVLTPVMSYPFKCCTLCLHDYHEAQISGEITAVNVHGVQAFLLIGQLWFSSLSHADGRCHLLVSSVWKALCHSLIIYIYMFFSAL